MWAVAARTLNARPEWRSVVSGNSIYSYDIRKINAAIVP